MKRDLLLLVLLFFAACGRSENPAHKLVDTSLAKKTNAKDSAVIDTPIWGYRFVIRGDFNGDGRQDTLTEHYYSMKEGRETNKFYSGNEDIYDLDRIMNEKQVISYFSCSDPRLDTIPAGGVVGPLFIKNEGDLDGDGGDEIGLVPSLPQASSINHYSVLSFKKGKWELLLSFEIREWELPPLPGAGRSYGPWGSDGMYAVADDSLNKALEQNLLHFSDLLQPLKHHRVRIKTNTIEAFDTTEIIDMRKVKQEQLL